MFKQFKIREREHFLRATLLPLAGIIDGMITLLTLGLYHANFGMKSMLFVAKKELRNRK